jgi:hypothetical protein
MSMLRRREYESAAIMKIRSFSSRTVATGTRNGYSFYLVGFQLESEVPSTLLTLLAG